MAWPPYLTTTHNPECCEKHSSASKIFVPSKPPAVIPTLDGGRIVVCGGTRAVAAVIRRRVARIVARLLARSGPRDPLLSCSCFFARHSTAASEIAQAARRVEGKSS